MIISAQDAKRLTNEVIERKKRNSTDDILKNIFKQIDEAASNGNFSCVHVISSDISSRGEETLKKARDIAKVLKNISYVVSVHKAFENDRGQQWISGGRLEISWE